MKRFFALSFVAFLAACSSNPDEPPVGTDSGTDAPSDARNDQQQADCGALVQLPPVVHIDNPDIVTTGKCDTVTFTVEAADGGTAPQAGAQRCAPTIPGCPGWGDDGGHPTPATCAYALQGLSSQPASAKLTVDVAAPGYVTAKVADVHSGVGGCADTPASDSHVTLAADVADAGHD